MIMFFQIILGLSILGFLFMAFRKIPVILNYPRHPFEEISLKQKIQERLQNLKDKANQSELVHKSLLPQTEKYLRKIKVFVLKFDNFLARIVGHLRKKTKEREENKEKDGEMPS